MTVRLLIAAAVLLGTGSVLPVGWLEYRRSGVRGQKSDATSDPGSVE